MQYIKASDEKHRTTALVNLTQITHVTQGYRKLTLSTLFKPRVPGSYLHIHGSKTPIWTSQAISSIEWQIEVAIKCEIV